MNFKFTIEDFLNDFGGGFVFLAGLVMTNYRTILSNIKSLSEGDTKLFLFVNELNVFNIIPIIIFTYIVGLTLSAITNLLEQDFYLCIDKKIRETYKENPKDINELLDQSAYLFIDSLITKTSNKKQKNIKRIILEKIVRNYIINKPLWAIKMITFFLFFRKWASIETINHTRNEFKKVKIKKMCKEYKLFLKIYKKLNSRMIKNIIKIKLKRIAKKVRSLYKKHKDFCERHEELQFIQKKTTAEIFQMEKEFRKDDASFDKNYWFKSQFWQISSNAIFFMYILNLFVFKSVLFYQDYPIDFPFVNLEYVTFLSVSSFFYVLVFFLGKLISPMYVKMWLRQISREKSAREQLAKDKETQKTSGDNAITATKSSDENDESEEVMQTVSVTEIV